MKNKVYNFWYRMNIFITIVFTIWLSMVLLFGVIFIPYNYYYYKTDSDMELVKDKLYFMLINNSMNDIPFRNRQFMYMHVNKNQKEINIVVNKVEIYSKKSKKIFYKKVINKNLKELFETSEDYDIFYNKNLGARENKSIIIKFYLKINGNVEVKEYEVNRIKRVNTRIFINVLAALMF